MKKTLALLGLLSLMSLGISAQSEVTLTVEDITLQAGDITTLYITANVPVTDYSAFQFSLFLPDGVKIAYDNGDETYGYWQGSGLKRTWIDSFGSGITSNHEINAAECEGGYIFLCSSPTLASFDDTSDEFGGVTYVLYVDLEASADAVNGNYAITLGNIMKFSRVLDGGIEEHIFPSVVAGTCTITGGEDEATIPLTMTEAGWSTLIIPFDHAVPDGLRAYTCSSYKGDDGVNWLTLTKAETLTANTPYLVAGTPGSYSFVGTPNFTQMSYTSGLLTGVYVATSITHGYVLQKQNDEVAFFKVSGTKAKTVPAYRCYMNDLPGGSTAFRFGETTAVESIKMDVDESTVVYDLMGRKCGGQLESGFYIRGNKKFYVK